MKASIVAAFVAIGLAAAVSQVADARAYQAPAHNYYQNNWMNG
jgi:hypothetical protein